MKALHLPFHVHRLGRRNVSTKLHHLLHDDRFWAIVTLVLLLALFVVISVLAVRSGAKFTFGAPYLH